MELDVVLLSRIQFALTIMFHYLFPPLAIGMGILLVYLGAMYLRTKKPHIPIPVIFGSAAILSCPTPDVSQTRTAPWSLS